MNKIGIALTTISLFFSSLFVTAPSRAQPLASPASDSAFSLQIGLNLTSSQALALNNAVTPLSDRLELAWHPGPDQDLYLTASLLLYQTALGLRQYLYREDKFETYAQFQAGGRYLSIEPLAGSAPAQNKLAPEFLLGLGANYWVSEHWSWSASLNVYNDPVIYFVPRLSTLMGAQYHF